MLNNKDEIPESIIEPMENCLDFLDFPTAWAIQKNHGAELKHDPRCSSVPGWNPLSGPGFLCDCGAVTKEWERLQGLLNA